MVSRRVERAQKRIEREAVTQGIDLDDVRPVDNVDAQGDVLRVLETDADDESNQVGFQIQVPPGREGYEMFETNIKKHMDALKEHLTDGESTGEDVPDPKTDDLEQTQESNSTETDPSVTKERGQVSESPSVPQSQMELTVALDDSSLEELQGEFDEFLTEVEDVTVGEERIDALEEQTSDLDDRLTGIEEKLSLLSGGD